LIAVIAHTQKITEATVNAGNTVVTLNTVNALMVIFCGGAALNLRLHQNGAQLKGRTHETNTRLPKRIDRV
jgi:hypothetical protein